jgi:predicted peptidase
VLTDLAARRTLETNYPAAKMLGDAEAIVAGKWDPLTPGQHWLALPEVTGSPVRVEVPKGLKKGTAVPVVFALHGAGGSENMFFDGYGDGLVAKLAIERGWLVVATRSGLFGGPDVPAVLDALAEVYPIDTKRVFILGHSMGAAQTAATLGRAPKRFAAAACLGGGGGVKASDALKKVPVFVGVGKLDFAARGAKSLAESLQKAGVEKVTFKAYDDLEHLTIVQRALPEVFALFDQVAKGR